MSDSMKNIVIATSLTEASDDIVRVGVAVARATGAVPWLVHVHSWPTSASELLGTVDGTWTEEHLLSLRMRLVLQAQRTKLTDLPGFGPLQIRAAMGWIPRRIVALARQIHADLIVVGGEERESLCRVVSGSFVGAVVRQAPCPVLVVRSPFTFPPARVEIATDLSPISANAVRQGIDLLTHLGVGLAETEALFILNPLEAQAPPHLRADSIERIALDELYGFLNANGVKPGLARVRAGHPREQILAVLGKRRVDLVILGTQQRRGFERLKAGSVAAGVMSRATCNLLIVPSGARSQGDEAELRGAAGNDRDPVSEESPAAGVGSLLPGGVRCSPPLGRRPGCSHR